MKKFFIFLFILVLAVMSACDNSSQPVPPPSLQAGELYAGFDGTVYGNVLSEGDFFPSVRDKDVCLSGDYIYRFDSSIDGWAVLVADDDTAEALSGVFDGFAFFDKTVRTGFGEIAESINGKPVKSLVCTFQNCAELLEAPLIPSGVTNLGYVFYSCSKLETLPAGFTIPSGTENLESAFAGCIVLQGSVNVAAEDISDPLKYEFCFLETGKSNADGCITLSGTGTNSDLLEKLKGQNKDMYLNSLNKVVIAP